MNTFKKKIYMDNASTSYPKAREVVESINEFLINLPFNINRGDYDEAYNVADKVYSCREKLCKIFNFSIPERAIFTRSVTESLNCVIKGLFTSSDDVIISSIEHNAVMRVINQVGLSYTKIPTDNKCLVDLSNFDSLVKTNTKAVILNHCSNVCGTLMPIREIFKKAHKHNLITILDTAQSAGYIDIDMLRDNIDVLCWTGHKGLGGPQGIGGFIINTDINPNPLIVGGTGSFSSNENFPEILPDKYEAGTLNLPGIIGLEKALGILKIDSLKEKKDYFLKKVQNLKGFKILGSPDLPVFAIDFVDRDNADIAWRLYSEYGIMTRTGLHCSPQAHKTLGTLPNGAVRVSFGKNTTYDDIDTLIKAIKCIVVD